MLKNRKQISILLAWIAVLLWMLLIFNLSSQVAEQSDKLSRGLAKVILETVEKFAPSADFDINRFNHLLRKNTHFFAYLMLGLLVMNAIRRSGTTNLRGAILAIGICILYAASDEAHQLFVPGRGGQAFDVLIDSSGAIIGIGIYGVVLSIGKKLKNV